MYRKLLVISMVYQGETISKASKYVHTSRKTGERWVKNYNEKGLFETRSAKSRFMCSQYVGCINRC